MVFAKPGQTFNRTVKIHKQRRIDVCFRIARFKRTGTGVWSSRNRRIGGIRGFLSRPRDHPIAGGGTVYPPAAFPAYGFQVARHGAGPHTPTSDQLGQ